MPLKIAHISEEYLKKDKNHIHPASISKTSIYYKHLDNILLAKTKKFLFKKMNIKFNTKLPYTPLNLALSHAIS